MRPIKLITSVSIILICLLLTMLSSGEAASKIYWTDASTDKIQRANLDGSDIEDIITTGIKNPHGIALDVAGGKMYWAEVDDSFKIRRANLNGTNVEDLVESIGPNGIALDVAGGKMYWTDTYITGKIHRANLDGTNMEEILDPGQVLTDIALDLNAGKMYWTMGQLDYTSKIQRANLDGSNKEDLVTTGLYYPRGIALDVVNNKMYLVNERYKKIQRANLDGTGMEDIVTTGLGYPHGIALDMAGGKMYWTDFGTDKIQRANLDGSNIENIVTEGLIIPVGIAIANIGTEMEVSIDVKPESDQNTVNLGSAGIIPVAIFSSEEFDALTIDAESIFLSGAKVRLAGKSGNYLCQERDVNNDDLVDLVCEVETAEFLIVEGTDMLELKATTIDGKSIYGKDYIRIVPN